MLFVRGSLEGIDWAYADSEARHAFCPVTIDRLDVLS
jgi:hypothetical protein